MKTLRELLTEYNIKEGYDVDDKCLEERLRETFSTVWEGDEDEHRWRIEYYVVTKIEDNGVDRYFKYSACKGTNDNSWEDAGYRFEGIDNVVEVFPQQVVTTIYK